MAMSALYDRALRAWRRFCATNGYAPAQPSASNFEAMTTQDGREYVALAYCRGLLAVYRVRPHGTLRRITRVPREIQALYESIWGGGMGLLPFHCEA
jgi:hypothetical protein